MGHKDKLRVLLIGDKKIDQEDYKLIQKQNKFRIIGEARSLNQALEKIDEEPPDFILIGDGAARDKGVDSIKRLRKSWPNIPIIMSSQGEAVLAAGALQAGASGYIVKQNIGQELVDAASKIERGQIYLSPLISKSISIILDMEKSTRLPTTPHIDDQHIETEESEQLTDRQKEILKMLVQGLTNKQVAHRLKLSVKTVDAHRANIMNKLRIHGLPGLVKYAIRIGLTNIED
jgi:DNA-binding NarL/FixJ family response regulator